MNFKYLIFPNIPTEACTQLLLFYKQLMQLKVLIWPGFEQKITMVHLV